MIDHKAAGYTHKIRWLEYSELFGVYLEKSFPTTPDAVELHLAALNKRRSEEEDGMITGIQCILLQ